MSTLVVTNGTVETTLTVDAPDVVAVDQLGTVVVVETPAPEIVNVVSAGPQGPVGPAGAQGPQGPVGPAGPAGSGADATSILGYPVNLTSGNADDLLSFTGSTWTNKPQVQVTDGGNF